MASLSNRVRLPDPGGELIIELIKRGDTELVGEQTLGVRRSTPDTRIFQSPLDIQVPVQPADFWFGAGESASRSLERDRRLGDRQVEGSARLHKPRRTSRTVR